VTAFASILHAGTLLVVNAILALLSAAIFIVLYATRPKVAASKGVLLWGLGYGAIALGFCILILPAFKVEFSYFVLLANLLIDAGTILTLFGVAIYLQRWGWELWALLPAAILGCIEIVLVIAGGESYRVMVPLGAGLRAIVTIATAIALWRCADDARQMAARLASVFHLVWAAMLGLRIIWWLGHPIADTAMDPTSTFGLLSRLLLTWAITPSYLWMLTRELDAELIRQARQDPLTGVANRRVIWAEGEKWAGTGSRKRQYLAVLIIDIDHFKAVNDNWGHGVGDEVLVGVAHSLAQHMRDEDLLARIGGEEFMALVRHDGPSIDQATDAIRAIAERLRQAIEKDAFPLPSGGNLVCTASIGYAISLRGQYQWKDIVEAADGALYDAKRNGRNQVMGGVYEPKAVHAKAD